MRGVLFGELQNEWLSKLHILLVDFLQYFYLVVVFIPKIILLI